MEGETSAGVVSAIKYLLVYILCLLLGYSMLPGRKK